MKILWAFSFVVLLCGILYTTSAIDSNDIIDDDEVTVAEEDETKQKPTATSFDKDLEPEDETGAKSTSSPYAETSFLFTEPAIFTKDLPVGAVIKFLVGFCNKGDKEFVVDTMDVSFRYPMDYTFFIQNYTDAVYNRVVAPKTESTFEYSFIPSEAYAGRPLALSINLRYSDTNKTQFVNSVYNETVILFEDESAFNPETGFLYVVFGCIFLLLLVLGQQFLSKMRKKHGMTKRSAPIEMGTSKNGGVDYDWIPKELLQPSNKSLNRRELRTRKDQ